ncbi:MAG: hypothetical protein IJT49_02200 [Clostridia bacterium]|nr:hypothetical protein [Clostridia bacterium]
MKICFKKITAVFLLAVILTSAFAVINVSADELPAKYVTDIKTPVLDQKNDPLCWAYSCSDQLNINAVKNGYAENGKTVFSAPMMARAEFDGTEHRHSRGSAWYRCYGGNDYALMAAISGKGLLYNSDYPTVDDALNAPESALYSGNAYVDDIRILETTDMSRKERTEAVKRLIIEYGSVNADVFVGDYNKVTSVARILTYDNSKASHVILLVGWDDTKYTDTGTGAFLMKNTWGESWGDNGYAWISYNSEFGRNFYAANVVVDEDTRVLTHTETIYASGNSYDASKSESGAVNVFEIDEKMTICKAGIYTDKPSSEICVRVYKNLSDISKISSASPDAAASGTAYCEGYYTLDLNRQIDVKENDTVTVLYLVKSGKSYYVYSEYADPDFELSVTVSIPGQSYTYVGGELREPKGNYIGTVIGKTEHKEPQQTETETVTETETETETEIITVTEETAYSDTEEPVTDTEAAIETDTLSVTETDKETEYEGTSLSEISFTETEEITTETDNTDTQQAGNTDTEKTDNNATAAIKKVFITVIIIIVAALVLFILLVLALIAASKKKKV